MTVNLPRFKLSSLLWVAVVFCTLTMPIAMIIIGAININDCPHEPAIAIILVVSGAVVCFSNVINGFDKLYAPSSAESQKSRRRYTETLTFFTNLSTVACLITACIYVYGSGFPQSYIREDVGYCSRSLFLFAFWTLNLLFAFIALLVVAAAIGFAWSRSRPQFLVLFK